MRKILVVGALLVSSTAAQALPRIPIGPPLPKGPTPAAAEQCAGIDLSDLLNLPSKIPPGPPLPRVAPGTLASLKVPIGPPIPRGPTPAASERPAQSANIDWESLKVPIGPPLPRVA